ncbi:MAG: outer membrane protein assembly factor BamB [Azoarcus sp.]|jgi:outer membrane protein assembly factor BamB|nr:outer membrane protein assembly factor BamB [Azoarcus sp.]
MRRFPLHLFFPVLALALSSGCSSTAGPADLVKFQQSAELHELWSVSVGGAKNYVFQPIVVDESVYAAEAGGDVVRIDGGKKKWVTDTKVKLSAGVGCDGEIVAVAGEKGEIIALDAETGSEKWRVNAGVEILAPPAVGGGVVVLRASDHRLLGLETKHGQHRWLYQRNMPPLALRSHSGVLIVENQVALAGFPGGKLVAVSLEHGGNLWELSVSRPRGATELERVSDVAGVPVLGRNEVCAVTYQGRVACFDMGNGNTLWTRDFSSYVGMDRDNRFALLVDERDSVQALDVYSGITAWRQDAMTRRRLTRPRIIDDFVVLGDGEGYVHVLGYEDGVFVARDRADNSAILADPLPLGDGFVVQSIDGDVVAYELRR